MKMKWRINRLMAVLACLALVLILISEVKGSLAYFTTYTTVGGSQKIGKLSGDTEVEEKVDGNKKTVTVKNTGEIPCYVRVRAYAGELFTLVYSGENWSENEKKDGWYYYVLPLEPNEVSAALTIEINWDSSIVADDFEVIVVEEFVPASYNEDGSTYGDWDAVITTKEVPYDKWEEVAGQ